MREDQDEDEGEREGNEGAHSAIDKEGRPHQRLHLEREGSVTTSSTSERVVPLHRAADGREEREGPERLRRRAG